MRDALLSAAKGAAIGGTMLIPGVSGGTTAMMLGIYDRLIQAVSGFRRHKRESFFFLLWFCLGACAGIFLLARPLLSLMEHFPRPAGFFFLVSVLKPAKHRMNDHFAALRPQLFLQSVRIPA